MTLQQDAKLSCPDTTTLLRWLAHAAADRNESVTEHVYDCSDCSLVVLDETRRRRRERLVKRLSAVAAGLLIAVGGWQFGGVIFAPAAAGEDVMQSASASNEETAVPVDPRLVFDAPDADPRDVEFWRRAAEAAIADGVEPPVRPDGTLWVRDGWRRGGSQGSTPYDNELEILGERPLYVIVWQRHFHRDPQWFEKWVEEGGSPDQKWKIPAGFDNPRDLSDDEFRALANRGTTMLIGQLLHAFQRGIETEDTCMIPHACLSLSGPEIDEFMGFANESRLLARRYLALFDSQTVRSAIVDFCPDDSAEQARYWECYLAEFGD